MIREVKGLTGRLVRGFDVLTDFVGWEAIAHASGEPGAEDDRPGATLFVAAHQPDDLAWPLRTSGELTVELDIGTRILEGPARIMSEEPKLTIEITGALEAR